MNNLAELSNKNTTTISTKKMRLLTTTSLFAALITIMTAFIAHIPTGINGGYIHLGDSLIYLAAALLPTPYAMLAAGIGGSFADLLSGAPVWAPVTLVIKMLICLPFTRRSTKIICFRNIIAAIIAWAVTVVGYFLAEALLFGSKVAFLASVGGNTIQCVGSAVFFILIGVILDKMNFKRKFIQW